MKGLQIDKLDLSIVIISGLIISTVLGYFFAEEIDLNNISIEDKRFSPPKQTVGDKRISANSIGLEHYQPEANSTIKYTSKNEVIKFKYSINLTMIRKNFVKDYYLLGASINKQSNNSQEFIYRERIETPKMKGTQNHTQKIRIRNIKEKFDQFDKKEELSLRTVVGYKSEETDFYSLTDKNTDFTVLKTNHS